MLSVMVQIKKTLIALLVVAALLAALGLSINHAGHAGPSKPATVPMAADPLWEAESAIKGMFAKKP